MAKADFFLVDAFIGKEAMGAPAPVVLVDSPIETDFAMELTRECGHPISVFVEYSDAQTSIRFFGANGEVGRVGHAGLAAAYCAFEHIFAGKDCVEFANEIDAPLQAVRRDGRVAIRLPVMSSSATSDVIDVKPAIGVEPTRLLQSEFGLVAILEGQGAVAGIVPDIDAIEKLPGKTLMVTAAGDNADFVSRVFAPKLGLPEDPVCGTAHRVMAPLWAAQSGKDALSAYQCSARGGEFRCAIGPDYVELAGDCRLVIAGQVRLRKSQSRC